MNKPAHPSILHPYADFWFLGGASIFLWAVMMAGQFFRNQPWIEQHFAQVGGAFALLSIFCNHPHFLISYRLAYSRGPRFAFQNPISLIAVPAFLFALFSYSFFNFHQMIGPSSFLLSLNFLPALFGINFRFGQQLNLGSELLSLSIWMMYLTVGWHYSKQTFGCMMVYANYDNYTLTRSQRLLLKMSVFSVAFYSFIYINSGAPIRMLSITLPSLELPTSIQRMSLAFVFLSAVASVYFVLIKNYFELKKRPSPQFLIPWIAFHVWWIPVLFQREFYFMAVPFFHSLQYLPFAFRVEEKKILERKYFISLTLRIALLLLVGLLAFEWIPSLLDQWFDTEHVQLASFFSISFIVFINVHHFFIDSVIWKFKQPAIKESLLAERAQP